MLDNLKYAVMSTESLSQELVTASSRSEIGKVKNLLSAKANVNFVSKYGMSPLGSACRADIIQCLLEAKANINLLNSRGDTPLLNAASNGREDVVRMLIQNNANLNVSNQAGFTPLMNAITAGHLNSVKLLIESKAQTSETNKQGDTALHLALYKEGSNNYYEKNYNITEYLITHSVSINSTNKKGDTPLIHLVKEARSSSEDEKSKLSIVKALIGRRADVLVKSGEKTALQWAKSHGEYGYGSIAVYLQPLVYEAIAKKDPDARQALSEELVEVSKLTHEPAISKYLSEIKAGYYSHQIACVQKLLELKADINFQSNKSDNSINSTPLIAALSNTSVMKILITAKADVNLCGRTHSPLTWAAGSQTLSDEAVKILLEAKANVHLEDKGGQLPLCAAVRQYQYREAAKILIDAKADVNQADKYGRPLSSITNATTGIEKTAQVLLDAKADVNYIDKDGFSVLLKMVFHGRQQQNILSVVKVLVAAGADVTHEWCSKTSCQWAHEKGHYETERFLKPLEEAAFAKRKAEEEQKKLASAVRQSPKIEEVIVQPVQNAGLKSGLQPLTASGLDRVKYKESQQLDSQLLQAVEQSYEAEEKEFINIQSLVEAKANINFPNFQGHTPLMVYYHTSYNRKKPLNENLIRLLIKLKADVNFRGSRLTDNSTGWTPLVLACMFQSPSKFDNEKFINILIENKADVNLSSNPQGGVGPLFTYGTTPLDAAMSYHSSRVNNVVSILIAAKADVNLPGQYGHTPLTRGSSVIEWVRELLEAKADPNLRDKSQYLYTPLIKAVYDNRKESVRALLEYKADPNRAANDKSDEGGGLVMRRKPLEEAIISGGDRSEILQLLIDAKADINIVTNYGGCSLLTSAGWYPNEEPVLRTLLEAKANINDINLPMNPYDPTPLTHNVSCGLKKQVQVLISVKADVNAPDKLGDLPLRIAANLPSKSIVQLLVDAKADIHLKNRQGCSPLISAVSTCNPHSVPEETKVEGVEATKLFIVKQLLQMGADATIKWQDKTASQYAEEAGYQSIVSYLRSIEQASLTKTKQEIEKPLASLSDAAVSKDHKSTIVLDAPFSSSALESTPQLGMITVDFTIRSSELKLVEPPIGRGAYGIVYKGEWRFNPVAVKKLMGIELDAKGVNDLQKEAKVMAQVSSRSNYLVKLVGICLEQHHYSLVMEYMPNGNLYQYIHSGQEISWERRYRLATDITIGLANLHEANVLHCDLKSLNVLLDNEYNAKLCDFGFSAAKNESSSTKSGVKGTPQWMAPELLDAEQDDHKPTKAADIYGLGMILWELATREMPYGKQKPMTVLAMIMSGKRAWQKVPADCPPLFFELIKQCCEENPTKRLTAPVIQGRLYTLWEETRRQSAPSPSPSVSVSVSENSTPASSLSSSLSSVFAADSNAYLSAAKSQGDVLRPL